MSNEHEDHGKGHEGPDDPDCACRGTPKEQECAKAFCGFCVPAQRKSLEERARFAARSVVEGASVMLSDDGIRAMAEFINGPKAETPKSLIGTCPICGGDPGKCVNSKHGYAEKK